MTTEEAAFQAKLDADPADALTRLVFADWLEERGDGRAEGVRAMGLLCKRPLRDGADPAHVRSWFLGHIFDAASTLPHPWLLAVAEMVANRASGIISRTPTPRRYESGGVTWWCDFGDRAEAEDFAARGWATPPPDVRKLILAGKFA